MRTTWAKISCYCLLRNKYKRSKHFQFVWKWSRGHSTLQKIPPIHRLGLRPGLEQKVRKDKKTLESIFFWNFSSAARIPMNRRHSENRQSSYQQISVNHNFYPQNGLLFSKNKFNRKRRNCFIVVYIFIFPKWPFAAQCVFIARAERQCL